MKRRNFRITGFRAFIFACLLGLALWGVASRNALWRSLVVVLADTQEDPVPVCTAEKETFTTAIPAQGEVAGLQSVPVQVPRTRTGALTLVWIAPEGRWVEPGETIVRFDSTDAMLSVEQQENTLKELKQRYSITSADQTAQKKSLAYDLLVAELEYQYSLDLIPSDETIISQWDLMEARVDSDLAKARVDFLREKERTQNRIDRSDMQILNIDRNSAEAEMEVAQQTLDSLEVKSPASGLVIYSRYRGKETQIGDQCWSGRTIAEIVDSGSLQARLNVLERDAGDLKTGAAVNIQFAAFPGRDFKGVIETVAPMPQSIERNSPLRYFICDARFQADPEHLKSIKPGMVLQAEIVTRRYDSCVLLPASAVAKKGSRQVVYIRQDGEFREREVQGSPGPQGLMVVTGGIDNGEIVALRNPFESRKLYLPDFGRAGAGIDASRPPMRRFRYR